jgi:hypothetical protein
MRMSEGVAVATAMRTADLGWRRELESQTLDDVRALAEPSAPHASVTMRGWHRR